jgi:hypothetical protein
MKQSIILLLSSLLALIFFEFFLKYSPFEYGISAAEYDKTIGMWHKRNFKNYIVEPCYKTQYHYDSEGLPATIVPYNREKKDVIILGDSFIEARMVKNENIIHNALAKLFNYKYNFKNYGLFGSGPTQQFIILRDKVDLNNTKYVIQFIELEGDLMDVDSKNLSSLARPKVFVEFETLDKYKVIPPREKTIYDTISDKLSYYQIYPFIKKTIYSLKKFLSSKKETTTEVTKDKTNEEVDLSKNWLYLKGAIYQIDKLIHSVDKNIQYKIVVRSKKQKNREIIKKFLNKHNIKFIFLNQTAKKMNIELKGFSCDNHWNDQAHKDVAYIIKEKAFIE